jgi:cathepsin C
MSIGFLISLFQGFEVVISERKYFAFSKYTQEGSKVISYCHELFPGWTHDSLGHDWACYLGKKSDGSRVEKTYNLPAEKPSLTSTVLKFESEYVHGVVYFVNGYQFE